MDDDARLFPSENREPEPARVDDAPKPRRRRVTGHLDRGQLFGAVTEAGELVREVALELLEEPALCEGSRSSVRTYDLATELGRCAVCNREVSSKHGLAGDHAARSSSICRHCEALVPSPVAPTRCEACRDCRF